MSQLDYIGFKGWQANREPRLDCYEAFDIETKPLALKPGARVLEIGFGEGHFLDWARDRGYAIVGVDLIPELVEFARAAGHVAYCGDINDPDTLQQVQDAQFDLIAAFDVLEHIRAADLAPLLTRLRSLLAPTGCILARFPNGGSPFGALYQAGDITHVTVLNASSIGQLALAAGLKVVSARNSARLMRTGRRRRIFKWLAYRARDTIELALGLIFFGSRIPMDPNMTVILRREAPRAGK